MSLTTSDQCSVPSPTFNPAMYRYYAWKLQEELIIFGLLGPLYGVLTILSVISGYALLTQRNASSQPTTVIVLGLTMLMLWASTTTYMVTCILYYRYDILNSFLTAGDGLWTFGHGVFLDFRPPPDLLEDYTSLQSCTSTAALTVNIVLGDAIVCWRTCVVWHKNRVVKAICVACLLATFVLGAVDAVQSCQSSVIAIYPDFTSNVRGVLFGGLSIGVAACVLSLSTNIMATLLVAHKAWQSRRRLRRYFHMGSRTSQVQKLFSLLIESGAVYSALWAIVVAFQVGQYNYVTEVSSTGSSKRSHFLEAFSMVAKGALVPLIAIYPAVIIILVAINRSHMEKGLMQNLESLPTPHISFTANVPMTSRHGENSSEDLPTIHGEGFKRYGDSEATLDSTSEGTTREPKVEQIV